MRPIDIAVLAALLVAAPLQAQSPQTAAPRGGGMTFTRIAPVPEPAAIPLYAEPMGSTGSEVWDRMGNQRVVRNVTRPTLTPVLPTADKATGAAVIVAPGGGFAMLSMDNEGWPVARWLADHGIAAFVLKYRLDPTPPDEGAFGGYAARMISGAPRGPDGTPQFRSPLAKQDGLAALRMVRARSAEWGIDAKRVGMLGFSAGAITALATALDEDPAARPDFFGFVYGPMSAVAVPADAPPMFAALANDDGLFGGRGFGIVDAWLKARRPVELHAYERSNHGYGMGRPGTTTVKTLPDFHDWMVARGLLAGGPPARAR